MTSQRELDRLLGAFFVEGTNEVADRVIEAALDQIDRMPQRHATRLPRRLQRMSMTARFAAAAVIAGLAIGGTLFLFRPAAAPVGASPRPLTTSPTASPHATPVTPSVTATPDIPLLTGPLGDGRQIHTATTLADGRVLIIGGFGAKDNELATAVLYDPATNTFSPTGSMAIGRGFHTATLLPDGHVLVTGGGKAAWVYPGPYLASAEVYDPATGTFGPTGSMTATRENHAATLLDDGRVLITGGNDSGDHATASAELYDPRTGTFTPTGSMSTARGYHTATKLKDGRVLVAGGDPANNNFSSLILTAEIYDPATGRFTPTGSMATARGFHTATLLTTGSVLVTGGIGNAGQLAVAEVYDPGTGTFSRTGTMADARVYQIATLLGDGKVLVAGGGGDYATDNFLASAEVFDPTTGTFQETGSMADARTWFRANLLPDGRVLVSGGFGHVAPLANAEIYDPTTGTFSPAG